MIIVILFGYNFLYLSKLGISSCTKVPAMGGEVAGFDTIVRQLMVDDPLKPEEEAALIGRGWR
jgi:hypothetical protein